MNILLITKDSELTSIVESFAESSANSTSCYCSEPVPIKVLSFFLTSLPSVVIVDDDFMTPNSVTLIESIRNVNQKTKIIFTTSDSSIELGKKVSQLGIYYYNIKPIDKSEFNELLNSIIKSKTQQSF